MPEKEKTYIVIRAVRLKRSRIYPANTVIPPDHLHWEAAAHVASFPNAPVKELVGDPPAPPSMAVAPPPGERKPKKVEETAVEDDAPPEADSGSAGKKKK